MTDALVLQSHEPAAFTATAALGTVGVRHEDQGTLSMSETGRRIEHLERELAEAHERIRVLETLHLTAAPAQFDDVAEKSPNMVFIHNGGRFVYVNPRYCTRLGYSREEVYAPTFSVLQTVAPESRDQVREAMRRHEQGEDIEPYEYSLITREGERLEAIVATRLIEYRGARATLGVITDITERRRAEQARAVSERLYRTVIETSPDAIFVIDMQGKFLMANPRGAELVGFDSVEALLASSITADNLAAPAYRESAVRRFRDLARDGHIEHAEYDVLRPDGTTIPVELSAGLLRDADGKVVGAIGIARDLTDRRRAEQERRQMQAQLEHGQRLESLGVLAGGIAHDFNNLLVGILGNVSLLRREVPERWNARGVVDRIESAAVRATELTRQMLAYAGCGTMSVGPVDLGAAVREMAGLLTASLPKHIRFEYELAPGLPPVRGDTGQIHQVVMNLILNAAEAVGSAPGAVHVSTRMLKVGVTSIDACTQTLIPAGVYEALEVTDTGCGMSVETRNRIFEPFFSTKFTGRGLGLAAVAGIVRAQDGAIWVDSQLGLGTTFHVLFPPIEPAANDVAPQRPKPQPHEPVTGGLVIVADDEELVSTFCRAALEEAGFQVACAPDGIEALALVRQRAEVVAAIIDVHMPSLNGSQTLERLRALRPHLPVVLTSGYAQSETSSGDLAQAYLQKPFTAEALRDAVCGVIEAATARAKAATS